MINSIVIENFQSHKKTILNLHPKVNAIVGNSNSGKTAILRALYWAIYNSPTGKSFISYWNRDKDDEAKENTQVSIINDTYKIERIRQKDFNGYELEINGNTLEPFEALRGNVPEQIINALNIGEVNIQRQMDKPFLLSESAGEVARFLNKEIRLDLIDKVLSNAEQKRRKFNNDVKDTESSIIDIGKELDNYTNLETAEKLNDQLKVIEKELSDTEDSLLDLQTLESEYKKYVKIIQNYVKIPFKNISLLLQEVEDLEKESKDIYKTINILLNMMEDIAIKKKLIKDVENDIITLEKLMPKNCPYCGNKLGEDKCWN